jgi:hypothetical protein
MEVLSSGKKKSSFTFFFQARADKKHPRGENPY